MRNEFSKATKEIFYKSRYCFVCGRTDKYIELHHIVGRHSNSPLNCCRICKECHEKILHTQEYERELFQKTKQYLLQNKYKLSGNDKEFLQSFNYLLI